MTPNTRRCRRLIGLTLALSAALAVAAVCAPGGDAQAQGDTLLHVYLPAVLDEVRGTALTPVPSVTSVPFVTPTQTRVPSTATLTPTGFVWPTDTPTSPPSPTPTQTPPPTPTSGLPAWQQYVNYHRWLARLPGVTENTTYSHGDELHARYMVKNNVIGHSESPGRQGYSAEGAEAAANGNVFLVSATVGATQWYGTYRSAIDAWMTGPFHMLGIIDPRLAVSGFGEYAEDIGGWHRYGATLDVLRGRGEVPPGVSYPVYYPTNGETIPNLAYNGGESPDPLVAPKCRGYTVPTGPPVALQLGTGEITPKVKRTAFTDGTTNLAHCWFDETTYPSSPGKDGLNMRDAIIVMPKDPLVAGQQYTVTIEESDHVYTWSFKADPASRPLAGGNVIVRRFPPALVPGTGR